MARACFAVLCAVLLLCACTGAERGGAVSEAAQLARRLSPQEQLRFDEYYLASVVRREKEEYDAAFELLGRALEINPDAPEALFDMAMLRLSMGGMMDSVSIAMGDSLLRRAVQLAPTNRSYKETFANLLVAKGELGEAASVYEAMAEPGPLSSETLVRLMQIYEHSQDYEAAIRTITRLEEKEGRDESLSLEKFRNYLAMGDSANAFRMVEELCAENPNDLRYRVLLGQTYIQNGHRDYGLSIVDSVLAVAPDNYSAQLVYLSHYAVQGEDSLVERQLRRIVLNPATPSEMRVDLLRQKAATELGKADGDTLGVLALMREALEMPQEDAALGELCAHYMSVNLEMPVDSLLPVVEKIIEVEPDNARARLTKLQSLLYGGEMGKVERFCQESQLYCPDALAFYYFEAVAAMQLDRSADALAALQRGVKQIDDSSDDGLVADVYALLGDLYHEAGRDGEAFAAYEESLRLNPDNALVLNNYAYFLALAGEELERAVEMSRAAADAEPQNATYLDTYAWCLYRDGEYEQARIYIDEALKYKDESGGADTYYDHAGDIYYACKQTAEAVALWRKALREADDPDRKRELERKIKRRRPN